MNTKITIVLVLGTIAFLQSSDLLPIAKGGLIHDQSDLGTSNTFSLTTMYVANDFTLTEPQKLNAFNIFARDSSPTLSNYSGIIGWGLFDNTGTFGALGSPGNLIASGSAVAPATFHSLTSGGNDTYKISGSLPNVSLTPGTYWFSVHEGAWGSGSDGTAVRMVTTEVGTDQGNANRLSGDTASYLGPYGFTNNRDNAFQLFAVPEPSTILLTSLGLLSLLTRRRVTNPLIPNP